MVGIDLFFLTAGALAGGFINGLAGFGTALFSLGFFLQVMTPLEAVSTSALLAIATGLQGLWNIRKHILPNKQAIARFLLPAIPAIPLGTQLATVIDPTPLKILVSILLIVNGILFFRGSLSATRVTSPKADYLVGLIGGFLGGLASLSGVLPSIWCSMKPWEKHKIRACLQVFNITILTLAVVSFALHGAYGPQQINRALLCLLVAMASAAGGIRLFNLISTSTFKRATVAICLFVGTTLLAQSVVEYL